MQKKPIIILLFAFLIVLIPIENLLSDDSEINQTPVGEDPDVTRWINKVERRYLKKGEEKWDKAITIFQRLIDSPQQPVYSKDNERYTPIHKYCHKRISQFSDAGREVYRIGFDSQAESLYIKGERERDIRILKEVRRRYYCSSFGDDALFMLGTILIDKGEYRQGGKYLSELIPEICKTGLAYPDTEKRLRKTAIAKLLLCYSKLGEKKKVEEIYKLVKDKRVFEEREKSEAFNRYIKAELEKSLNRKTEYVSPENWEKFYGNANRWNMMQEAKIMLKKAKWKEPPGLVDLNIKGALGNVKRVLKEHYIPAVSTFVYKDLVFVRSTNKFLALDLFSGKIKWPITLSDTKKIPSRYPYFGKNDFEAWRVSADYTSNLVTIHEGKIFVVDGNYPKDIHSVSNLDSFKKGNKIKVLDIKSQGKIVGTIEGKGAKNGISKEAKFIAPPTILDDKLYTIAFINSDYYMCCYKNETPYEFLWKTYICSYTQIGRRYYSRNIVFPPEGSVITIADGVCYWLSNNGVIVAIDSQTGEKEWLVKYKRVKERSGTLWRSYYSYTNRQISPIVITEFGTLIVAPSDSKEVLSLHLENGELDWPYKLGMNVSYIAGYSNGQVIFVGDYLFALGAKTGKIKWQSGDKLGTVTGRGAVTSDNVYVPCSDGLKCFSIKKGGKIISTLSPPPDVRLGNILITQGVLISTSFDKMAAFFAPEFQLTRLNRMIKESPNDPKLFLNRGSILFDLKRVDDAISDLEKALAISKRTNDDAHRNEAKEKLYHIYIKLATEKNDRTLIEKSKKYITNKDQKIEVDFLLAKILEREKKIPEALKAYYSILKNYKDYDYKISNISSVRIDFIVKKKIKRLIKESSKFWEKKRLAFEKEFEKVLNVKENVDMLKDLFKKYSETPFAAKVLFLLGKKLLLKGEHFYGIQNLNLLVNEFPKSKFVPYAYILLADYYKSRNWIDPLGNTVYEISQRFKDKVIFSVPFPLHTEKFTGKDYVNYILNSFKELNIASYAPMKEEIPTLSFPITLHWNKTKDLSNVEPSKMFGRGYKDCIFLSNNKEELECRKISDGEINTKHFGKNRSIERYKPSISSGRRRYYSYYNFRALRPVFTPKTYMFGKHLIFCNEYGIHSFHLRSGKIIDQEKIKDGVKKKINWDTLRNSIAKGQPLIENFHPKFAFKDNQIFVLKPNGSLIFFMVGKKITKIPVNPFGECNSIGKPIVYGNSVIACMNKNSSSQILVYCMNSKKLKKQLGEKEPFKSSKMRSRPFISKCGIMPILIGNRIEAFELPEFKSVWKIELKEKVREIIYHNDEKFAFIDGKGRLYLVNIDDGKVVWQNSNIDATNKILTAKRGKKNLYIAGCSFDTTSRYGYQADISLACLRLEDGKLQWKKDYSNLQYIRNVHLCAFNEGVVFTYTQGYYGNRTVLIFDGKGEQSKAKITERTGYYYRRKGLPSAPVIKGKNIFVGMKDGIRCYKSK